MNEKSELPLLAPYQGAHKAVVREEAASFMRRSLVTISLVLVVLLNSHETAFANAKITVSLTEVQNVLTPRPHEARIRRNLTYFLSRDGKVSRQYSSPGRFSVNGSYSYEVPRAGYNPAGVPQVARMRIENGAIVTATFLPSYKIITRIRTDGKSTCSAQRVYELLPGHRVFEDKSSKTHEDVTMSSIRAEDILCTIEDLAE
jgi:hypothetical protein